MTFSDGCRIKASGSLLGEERTWRRHRKSVVRDPKRHFATVNCRIAKGLFDYFVGSDQQRWRHVEAECFGCLEIDDEF